MSRFSIDAPSRKVSDLVDFWENKSSSYSAVSDPCDFNRRYEHSDNDETRSLQPSKRKKVRFKFHKKHWKPKSESPNELSLKIKSHNTNKKKKKATRSVETKQCLPSPNSSTQHEEDVSSSTMTTFDGSTSVEQKRLMSSSFNYSLNYDHDGGDLSTNAAYGASVCSSAVPQTVVHIENSSNIIVNTGDSAGPSVGGPMDSNSQASYPAIASNSRSSADRRMNRNESDCIRNTVADDTKDLLEDYERRSVSVRTKRLEEARRQLREGKHFLILTGYQQEGLSSLGYDLLLDFHDREKFVVMKPDQAITCMSSDKLSITFADDIFGTTCFDDKLFEEWQRNMNRIQRVRKRNNAILILGLHLELTKEIKCKEFYDYYQDDILNISIPCLQLDHNEMKSVLIQNINAQKDILRIEVCESRSEESFRNESENPSTRKCKISKETIEDIVKIANPSGFPGQAALFTRNVDNINRGTMFFSLPSNTLFSAIEGLRNAKCEDDINKYLALTAVFIYGRLNIETLEMHSKYLKKSEKQLNAYLALCFGNQKRLVSNYPQMATIMIGVAKRFNRLAYVAESVKMGVHELLGRYLVEDKRGRIEFASVSVERAVGLCCAQEYPVEVISFSSSNVFNSIIGPDDAFQDKQLHVSVIDTGKPCRALTKRLQTLAVSDLIQHPAMRSAWFARQFIHYLQKDKRAFFTFVMSTCNDNDSSVLTQSLRFPYKSSRATLTSCLAEDIIMSNQWQTIKNRNHDFAKEREKELLEKCCEMRWENAYSRLKDKLQMSLSRRCLTLAVNSGSAEILKDISQRVHKLSEGDWYKALEQACEKLDENDENTLSILLIIKMKVKFEYQSNTVESIIHRAARSGNAILLSKVISLCDNKDLQNSNGETCLHLATAANHVSCVQVALENGVSQTVPNTDGELPIHYACRQGYEEIALLLIAHDIYALNCASKLGRTPLHVASQHGQAPIVGLLLDKGVNVNAIDKKRKLPAHYALTNGFKEVFRYLIDTMDFHFPDPTLNTLFDKAVELKNDTAIDMILNKIKNEVDKLNLFNFSLLKTLYIRATDPENSDIVAYLLKKGADPNYPFRSGLNRFRCSAEILQLLMDKGCHLNYKFIPGKAIFWVTPRSNITQP